MSSSSWVMEIVRSESFHTVVVLLCSLVAFWPFLAGSYHITDLESSILRATLNEQSIKQQSAAVALALLVPLILDWMADLLGRWFGGKKKHADSISTMGDLQKGCLFVGLAIVPCMAYVTTEYDSLALLWFCLSRFQVVLVLGTLHVSFGRFANRHRAWPWWSKLLGTMILITGVNLTTWTSIEGLRIVGPIPTLATSLKAIALCLVVIPSGRWLLHAGKKLYGMEGKRKIRPNAGITVRKSSASSSSINDENAFAEEKLFFPALYILIGTICYTIVILMFMTLGSASEFNTDHLLIYNSAFILVEVGLLFYYLRKIKYESLYNLSALIESRKQYLRYIAHEMRTPLNSAVLGLKLICDSLATIQEKGN